MHRMSGVLVAGWGVAARGQGAWAWPSWTSFCSQCWLMGWHWSAAPLWHESSQGTSAGRGRRRATCSSCPPSACPWGSTGCQCGYRRWAQNPRKSFLLSKEMQGSFLWFTSHKSECSVSWISWCSAGIYPGYGSLNMSTFIYRGYSRSLEPHLKH